MSTSASTPVDSMPGTPGASTPGSITDSEIDPLPTFTSLDLSLSRDQGTLHHRGYGAGSEAYSLSHVATTNHEKIAHRILSQSSVGANAGGALSPENLPQAPKELPQSPQQVNSEFLTPATSAAGSAGQATQPSSTLATPGESRVGTPNLGTTSAHSPQPAVQSSMPPPPAPSSGTSSTTTAAPPSRPAVTQKKSVFGKLFERGGNASQASLHSNGATTPSHEDVPSAAANGATGDGGANLTRKPSKKEREETEKREKKELKEREKEAKELRKEQERERAPSQVRGRANSHGQKEKSEGLGQALNDFMKNKVQRKSSQSGKRSEDGKSERGGGSQAGDSEYGGSSKGNDLRSRSGSQAGSLSKKYGVCEKQVIGKGATATVKLAHKWDRSTERLYAVKEFRKRRKNETEKEYVKKLTSEFCISSTLHHHNVVETVDLVQDEQNHWCEVMEYCPGGDLYAAIKKGDMAPPEINSYFKQIIAGVGYLHSMGVAHRDIKPENLLLDAKGHVKITDFGVSDVFRMCWEKTTHLSKGLCGSEPYIAPEQFEQKEYDARLVDIWACAIVFYCMHFQELPWRVAKPSDPSFGPYLQLYTASSSPPPLSNLVPRECRNIIRKMLDPDPKSRAKIEEILKDSWFESIKVIPPIEADIIPKILNGSMNSSAAGTPNPLASPSVA